MTFKVDCSFGGYRKKVYTLSKINDYYEIDYNLIQTGKVTNILYWNEVANKDKTSQMDYNILNILRIIKNNK